MMKYKDVGFLIFTAFLETLRVFLTNSTTSGKVTMEYAKSSVLNEEVIENLKTYLHIQILYIQKIEEDKRQETRGVEVKAEANQNSRTQILYVII